jgi:hypothetical protein
MRELGSPWLGEHVEKRARRRRTSVAAAARSKRSPDFSSYEDLVATVFRNWRRVPLRQNPPKEDLVLCGEESWACWALVSC